MTAVEAADAIADGWHTAAPGDDLDLAPMSDGGPGFVDVLRASLGGRLVTCTVRGPRDEPVPASFLVVDGTAYVESAQACGLHLVPEGERDPGALGTAGVGELLARAGREADRVVVGLGGSGTNDGGAGLLQAIGWGLYDGEGRQLSRGGTALAGLARVEPAGAPAAAIVAASDVDNPLLGLEGATATYGPQKGASADDVQRLDAALRRCADVVEDALGRPGLREKPGAGAAGGLGFALLALGGTRESGVELVVAATRLAQRAALADLVITGEGSLDGQSLRGKTVSGVAGAAAAGGVACVAIAGRVEVGRRELAAAGIEAAYSVTDMSDSGGEADAHADTHADPPAVRLRNVAAGVAEQWSVRGR